jgi:hypothetical protein
MNAEVLHRDLFVILELGIRRQALWLNIKLFDAIDLDLVQLATLLPLLRLMPLLLRGMVGGHTLRPIGLDVRLSLFALEAVEFITQALVLLTQFLVLRLQGLDQVEQHHGRLPGALKVLDLGGIKAF